MALTSNFPLAIMPSMRLEFPIVPTMIVPEPEAAKDPFPLDPTLQSSLIPVTLKIMDEFAVAVPLAVSVPLTPVTRPKSIARSWAARSTPGQSAASARI
jgi:hypothetical protein